MHEKKPNYDHQRLHYEDESLIADLPEADGDADWSQDDDWHCLTHQRLQGVLLVKILRAPAACPLRCLLRALVVIVVLPATLTWGAKNPLMTVPLNVTSQYYYGMFVFLMDDLTPDLAYAHCDDLAVDGVACCLSADRYQERRTVLNSKMDTPHPAGPN